MADTKKRIYYKVDWPLKILTALAVTGAITSIAVMAAVMPNLPLALAPFLAKGKEEKERWAKNRITRTIWALKERGLIKNEPDGKLSLTKKGQKVLLRWKLKEMKIKKPRRWDGKWRLVTFDVWESRKKIRENLRRTLINLGFIQLQKSIWAHPYECEDIIGLLRTELRLSPAIQYMVVERMDRDHELRGHFRLPLKRHYL